jgi:hypothetical protein
MAPPYICLNHLMGKNFLFHLEKRPAVRTWQTSVYIRGCVLYVPLCCTTNWQSYVVVVSHGLFVSKYTHVVVVRIVPI